MKGSENSFYDFVEQQATDNISCKSEEILNNFISDTITEQTKLNLIIQKMIT